MKNIERKIEIFFMILKGYTFRVSSNLSHLYHSRVAVTFEIIYHDDIQAYRTVESKINTHMLTTRFNNCEDVIIWVFSKRNILYIYFWEPLPSNFDLIYSHQQLDSFCFNSPPQKPIKYTLL